MNKAPFSVVLIALISSLGAAQISLAAPTEKRRDVQQGMLEQEMTAIGMIIFEKQYWMDYGEKVFTVREQEQKFLGMTQSSVTFSLELDGKLYVWKRDAKTGTVQDIEKIQKQVLQGADPTRFGKKMMKEFGAKEDGFLTKLGRKCKKIILTKMMNQVVCLWKKIPLFMEVNFGGMVSRTEVLKIEESAPDSELFVVPTHIKFSPAPDLEDITNVMKGNRNAFPPDQKADNRSGNRDVPSMQGLQELLQGLQGTQNQSERP